MFAFIVPSRFITEMGINNDLQRKKLAFKFLKRSEVVTVSKFKALLPQVHHILFNA
jgi:hypothetical protein